MNSANLLDMGGALLHSLLSESETAFYEKIIDFIFKTRSSIDIFE